MAPSSLVDENGVRTHIPVGGLACLMLEPGTRASARRRGAGRAGGHAADLGRRGRCAPLCRRPAGRRARRSPAYQARLALDDDARLRVVRKMYALRFGEEPPARRSVDQLRGIEGARVRETYQGCWRSAMA